MRDSVDMVSALKRPWQVSCEGVTVTLAFGIPGISSYFPVEEEDRDPVLWCSTATSPCLVALPWAVPRSLVLPGDT